MDTIFLSKHPPIYIYIYYSTHDILSRQHLNCACVCVSLTLSPSQAGLIPKHPRLHLEAARQRRAMADKMWAQREGTDISGSHGDVDPSGSHGNVNTSANDELTSNGSEEDNT